jgi:ABC-2 type transport system permease protein
MMILHLVKKDFLLVKKYICFMMLLAVAVPLFVAWRVPTMGGVISFIYTVVFTELIICQSISVEESKYPKAAALLCSAPYPRSTFVKAKYVFFLLLFAYCYVVYALMALVVPNIDAIDLTIVLSVLLFGVILYGVYLPLYFKHGAEKTKFFFMICIFAISFGSPMFYQYFANTNINFSMLTSTPALTKNTVLALAIIIALGISQGVPVRIFSKKDL